MRSSGGRLARLLPGCCAICSLTLDRPSLHNARGIIRRDKPVADGLVKRSNRILVFVTDAGGIAAKGVFRYGKRSTFRDHRKEVIAKGSIAFHELTGKARNATIRIDLKPVLAARTA